MTRMQEADLRWHKHQLLRTRWQLLNRAEVDPHVLPAALDWIDGEVADIEKALSGVGAA